jgi:pimeloyl-ACP methyl ester carboxylesterase
MHTAPHTAPKLVFSHANSFPASTYRVLFKHLENRGMHLEAIEKFGHTPQYPVTNNWPHLIQQLVDFTTPLVARWGEPVWLVGHSLGGYISLMAAAQNPQLTHGVILLDSPTFGGWRATALGLIKTSQLMRRISPGAISRKRRNNWASTQDAFAHFQHKKSFRHWHPAVLQDYVDHGTLPLNDQRTLAFDRDIETAIYNTVPDNLQSWLRRYPLRRPVSFIGATHSAEIRQAGLRNTIQITQGRVHMLNGSHLFPMDNPASCAAAIESALLNMQAL